MFTLIEDSIYKRRSTGDTQVALTDTIYEKVRSSFFPAAIRFALKPEKGRSCYLCNYGLCWPLFRSSTLFSLLCSIESYQTRLTSDQPAKGCEVGPGTKNESISVYGTEVAGRRPLNCSSAIQWWLVPIQGIMPGRRSSTVGSRRVRFGSRARTRNRRSLHHSCCYVREP